MDEKTAICLAVYGAVVRGEFWTSQASSVVFRDGRFCELRGPRRDFIFPHQPWIVDVKESWNRYAKEGHALGKIKLCQCGEELFPHMWHFSSGWGWRPDHWHCQECGNRYDELGNNMGKEAIA